MPRIKLKGAFAALARVVAAFALCANCCLAPCVPIAAEAASGRDILSPVIVAPLERELPDAFVGETYVGADGKASVAFEAAGNPKPAFYLGAKMNSRGEVTETAKSRYRDGHAYWSGAGLPDGLELSQSSGEVTGTPQDDGGKYPRTFTFTVRATNDVRPDAAREYQITVRRRPVEPAVPVTVTVPDVAGKSKSQAMRILAAAGLGYKVTTQRSASVPSGKVISHTPAAGASVSRSSTVTLVVSSGDGQADTPKVLKLALYAYSTDSFGRFAQRLGENGRTYEDGAYWVPGGIKTAGGQVRLCAHAQLSDGTAYYQNESSWPEGLALSFSSSDANIAAVSKSGIVTATGDGTVTLTASADGVSAQIKCAVVGQASPYPVEVQITNEKGADYGDERVTFSEISDSSYVQLYVRVVMSDGTKACNAPKADDYVDPKGTSALARVLSGVRWSTSNTQKGYVNEETGFFKPRDFGTFKVYASVKSAGADDASGLVSGYLWVKVDSGSYGSSTPSQVLNVSIVYERDESKVVERKSFTLAQLRGVEEAACTYTFTSTDAETGERNWVTSSAKGMYLTTLLGLMNVSTEDLYAMRLAANDGVNPGLLTSDFLFHERWYWPNYEYAANTVGGRLVFPMIAYESDWRSSAAGSTSCAEDYTALDEDVRFRLMFGAIGKADGTQSKSIKYINTVTLVLKGAPPSQLDPNAGQTGGGGSTNADQSTGDGNAQGNGNAEASGADSGQMGAQNNTGPSAENAAAGAAQAKAADSDSINDADGSESQGAKRTSMQEQAREASDSANAWHIYQMMNRAQSPFTPDDDTPPLVPIAAGLAAAVGAFSLLRRYVAFHVRCGLPLPWTKGG